MNVQNPHHDLDTDQSLAMEQSWVVRIRKLSPYCYWTPNTKFLSVNVIEMSTELERTKAGRIH